MYNTVLFLLINQKKCLSTCTHMYVHVARGSQPQCLIWHIHLFQATKDGVIISYKVLCLLKSSVILLELSFLIHQCASYTMYVHICVDAYACTCITHSSHVNLVFDFDVDPADSCTWWARPHMSHWLVTLRWDRAASLHLHDYVCLWSDHCMQELYFWWIM